MRGQGLALAAHRSSLPRETSFYRACQILWHSGPTSNLTPVRVPLSSLPHHRTACALPPCKSHHRITLKAPRLTLTGCKHHSLRVWTQCACQPADVPDKHPVFRGNPVKLPGKRQKEISAEGRDPQLRWLCLRHPRCSRRACGVSRGGAGTRQVTSSLRSSHVQDTDLSTPFISGRCRTKAPADPRVLGRWKQPLAKALVSHPQKTCWSHTDASPIWKSTSVISSSECAPVLRRGREERGAVWDSLAGAPPCPAAGDPDHTGQPGRRPGGNTWGLVFHTQHWEGEASGEILSSSQTRTEPKTARAAGGVRAKCA